MNQTVQTGSHELLSCFFEECERQFRFLEEEHGFTYISGLLEYKKHCKLIKPYNGKTGDLPEPFFAVTRYELDKRAIEIFYGDHNYALEVYVYPDLMQRLVCVI